MQKSLEVRTTEAAQATLDYDREHPIPEAPKVNPNIGNNQSSNTVTNDLNTKLPNFDIKNLDVTVASPKAFNNLTNIDSVMILNKDARKDNTNEIVATGTNTISKESIIKDAKIEPVGKIPATTGIDDVLGKALNKDARVDVTKALIQEYNSNVDTKNQISPEVEARLIANYTPEQQAAWKDNPTALVQAAKDSEMYGDFANQADALGLRNPDPYYNPFNKQSIDALPEATRNELLNRQDEVGKIIRQTYYGTADGQPAANSTTTNQSSIITNALDKQLIDAARGMNGVQREFLFNNNPGLEAKFNAVMASEAEAAKASSSATQNIINTNTSQSAVASATANVKQTTQNTIVSAMDQQLINAARGMNDVQRKFLFSQNPGLEAKFNAQIASEQSAAANTTSNASTTSAPIVNSNVKATSSATSTSTSASNLKSSATSTASPTLTSTTSSNAQNDTSNESSNKESSTLVASTQSTNSMSLDNDKVKDIINRFNTCIDELENTIKSIETGELATINNSWIAFEAKTFTNKVVDSNGKARKVNDGLNLLSRTYNDALNESQSTSSAVSSAVNNI